MIFSSAAIVVASQLLAVSATPASSPVGKRSPLGGLSLPPLIPNIPGVTQPLADGVPPLPILQVPTPALDTDSSESQKINLKNIKPKKIGYIWTGAGDNHHKDFLAAISLDDVRIEM